MTPPSTLLRCTVTGIDTEKKQAMVRDQLGKERVVTLTIIRVGVTPAVDEVWLIDRTLGRWSFAAKIDAE